MVGRENDARSFSPRNFMWVGASAPDTSDKLTACESVGAEAPGPTVNGTRNSFRGLYAMHLFLRTPSAARVIACSPKRCVMSSIAAASLRSFCGA